LPDCEMFDKIVKCVWRKNIASFSVAQPLRAAWHVCSVNYVSVYW